MNKYAALGLAVEANDGKTVLVITGSAVHSEAARGWLERCEIAPSRVCRRNGEAEVTYPSGGRVVFRSKRQGIRGLHADVVFVDSDTELTLEQMRALRPHVAATGGVIVRA